MNDRSDGVAGRGRPSTDKSTKYQKGLRQTVAEVTTHSNGCPKDRNKVLKTERYCARQAHTAVP